MVLQFLCPNGHKIHCPEDRGGMPAKCPKCGVKFQVPSPDESDSVPSQGPVDTAEGGSTVSAGAAVGVESAVAEPVEDQIEFLCPNGHRLHGPASLQGQPGQCPECSSRFRVPTYDDVPEEAETEAQEPGQIGVGHAAAGDGIAVEAIVETPADESAEEVTYQLDLDEISGVAPTPPPRPPAKKSVANIESAAELMARLWKFKASGATIELQWGEDQSLQPENFARAWSHGPFGVFSVQEEDMTHTVSAVAWEAISRVLVRTVKQLPPELSG